MLVKDADTQSAVKETAATPVAATEVGSNAAADHSDEPTPATVRTINGPAAEPIDAFSLGGSAMLKRLLPFVGGLVVLLLLLRRRKN
jgi:hypothetical protein